MKESWKMKGYYYPKRGSEAKEGLPL